MRTQLLPILGPSVKVVLGGDRSADALRLPNGPELLEGRSAVDRGLVCTGGLENIIGSAVGGNGTLLARSRSGVIGAVRLNDVVLDERVARPAVERNV